MKYCRQLSYSLILLIALDSFAQPKLVGALTYNGTANGGSIFRINVPSATPGIIYSFNNLAPHRAVGGVVAGDGDWLYGNLLYNGTNGNGAFYKIARDGTGFTKLYDYVNLFAVRMIPYYHTDGMLYFCDGSVFKKYDPVAGTFTDLNVSGFAPVRNLLIDADGWMYFTEQEFNPQLVKMQTDGSSETVLHTFNGPAEGNNGYAGITEIPGDTLFGVQTYGGNAEGGTLYSIKKDGTGFVVHRLFSPPTGINPESKLVYFDGKLFGTTSRGGDFDRGVLFVINPDGSNYRVLHHFDAGSYGDGSISGNISISSNGRIFGSYSQFVGNPSAKRFFKVDTSGANFGSFFDVNQRESGHFNQDILLLDDETIFLATAEMGLHDGGALSRCDTSGSGFGLYHFGYSVNGFRPRDGLIKGSDGKLYGSTSIGGVDGSGIIFSLNADGTGFTKLHELSAAEGYETSGKLLEASDGKIYGACKSGGPTNTGCIYRMNKNGSGFQVLYTFPDFFQGYSPVGSLIEDNSGVLYGTTFYGSNSGAVFKINKDGTGYTMLKSFLNSPDLAYPYNGLVRAGEYLYGACGYGGSENKGGIFRIKRDGSSYQVLHDFTAATVGELPVATPVIGNDGKLYGTTANGGNGDGIVYRLDTTGANYTVLKAFSFTVDGSTPWGGLIQASDGLLYGTTYSSSIGVYNGGTVYKMNTDGTGFAVIKVFDYQAEGQGSTSLLDLQSSFALPVEFLSFNAEKKGQTVLLTWKTAQEMNNDHFDIQRSNNINSFNTIGTMKGRGNTNLVTTYSFTDNGPLDGTNYYRLNQVDIDGKSTYSRTVSVTFTGAGVITIYPNPATEQLNIRLPQAGNYITARVVNASGMTVLEKKISSPSENLDVRALPAGWYTLQLIGKEQQQLQFLKQ